MCFLRKLTIGLKKKYTLHVVHFVIDHLVIHWIKWNLPYGAFESVHICVFLALIFLYFFKKKNALFCPRHQSAWRLKYATINKCFIWLHHSNSCCFFYTTIKITCICSAHIRLIFLELFYGYDSLHWNAGRRFFFFSIQFS